MDRNYTSCNDCGNQHTCFGDWSVLDNFLPYCVYWYPEGTLNVSKWRDTDRKSWKEERVDENPKEL